MTDYGAPKTPKPKAAAPVMVLFGLLCLLMAVFTPRFLVALPIFGSIGLCIGSFLRKERWRLGGIPVGVLALGLLVLAQLPPEALAAAASVKYSVSGTARLAHITLTNAEGGTEQLDASLPWTNTMRGRSGDYLYLSAQNAGDHGVIFCGITVNGDYFRSSSSSADYGIASCSGAAP